MPNPEFALLVQISLPETMSRASWWVWAVFFPIFLCPSTSAEELLLKNGRIVTMNDAAPEAQALAAKDGRIVAVGTNEEAAAALSKDARTIDLKGRLAIPGFVESHAHFMGIGDLKMQLNLMDARSYNEIVARVQAAVAEAGPGVVIRGRGWHQEKWDAPPEPSVDGLPIHDALSRVSPQNPVVLVHASGHASFANQAAMNLADIDRDTPDPTGGEIVRDELGKPIGMFRETAARLLSPVFQAAPQSSRRRVAELAAKEVLSKGITTFVDAGSSMETVDAFREMVDEGAMPLRLSVMLNSGNRELAARMKDYRMVGYGDHRLTVRAVKRLIDGALGAHGAWLLDPYSDLPGSAGLNTTSVEAIEETALLCLKNGFQLCIHAIGDRANREVLDAYERAFNTRPEGDPAAAGSRRPGNDLRWRIEHAQHLHPDDIPRFKELGVIASMEGIHCTSDGPYVPTRLGEERSRSGAYVWRSLLDAGAIICNGTDAPVEDVDPIACYYATVSRRMNNGEQFYPEQVLSRMEALRTYTLAGAYGIFDEENVGSLEVGKLADVTVLSKDILTVPEDQIRDSKVVYTIVGGEVQYRAASDR